MFKFFMILLFFITQSVNSTLHIIFRKQRQIKFASRSLKAQLHQINLLILLCSLKWLSIQIKSLRQKKNDDFVTSNQI